MGFRFCVVLKSGHPEILKYIVISTGVSGPENDYAWHPPTQAMTVMPTDIIAVAELTSGYTPLIYLGGWNASMAISITRGLPLLYVYGGCRKFLLLFGRIGPLALRPCALLRAGSFCHPHSINISSKFHGDMVIWIDMVCLALALAPSCAALHFWCLYIMLSKSYLPRRCDWKDGFFINPHIYILYIYSPLVPSSV